LVDDSNRIDHAVFVGIRARGEYEWCFHSESDDGPRARSRGPTGSYIVPPGIHKIQQVINIEQENRSFDSCFGTFPSDDAASDQPTD
jgi:phospholipase C